jgi:hypothetical protein
MNQPMVPDRVAPPAPPDADAEPHVVEGLVTHAVRGPLAETVVEAYDRTLQRGELRDELLATARTDAEGRYRIAYSPADGKTLADLTVRALDERGQVLSVSRMHYRAGPAATIDLMIGGAWRGHSDRDQIVALLGDTSPADIDDATAAFVADSRGVGGPTVDRLRASARVARDHRVSPELLYALASQGMPTELRSMLGSSVEQMKDAVGRAVEANAVSRRLESTLDQDLEGLRVAVVAHALAPGGESGPSLGDLLGTGVTGPDVHREFLSRYVRRTGTVVEFWTQLAEAPTFGDPRVVADLRLSLQLALLTQANLPLLRRLAVLRREGRVSTLADLTTLERHDWSALLSAAAERDGELPIPRNVAGATPSERAERYLDELIEPLRAAFASRYLQHGLARMPDVDMALVRRLRAANPALDPDRALPAEPAWGDIAPTDQARARASWDRLHAELTAYPDLAHRVLMAGNGAFHNPIRAGVHRLLVNLGDADLRTTNIGRVIAERGGAAFDGIVESDREAVVTQLRAYQRVFRVASRAEHVEYLLGAGLPTARSIAMTSRRGFVRAHAGALGGNPGAAAIHDAAVLYAGSVQMVLMAGHEAHTEVMPWVIPGGPPSPNGGGGGGGGAPPGGPGPAPAGDGATLENLFGPMALCDCEHCRSVYSPAAYLVDLLHTLDPPIAQAPITTLRARRPDLENTLLTCANTNTPIPYIDLVNEVLEAFVHLGFGPGSPGPGTVVLPARDTGDATAEELRAVPQHVVDEAYDRLAAEVFPMALPFHRALAVVRTYLDHVGVSRRRLLETYGQPGGDDLAAEALGMSMREYRVIAGLPLDPPRQLWEFYGYPNEAGWLAGIAQAPEFTRRTGITFIDLVELVKTWFVNPAQAAAGTRIALASPGECDVEHTTIANLDAAALDRAHRFLRLWHRLGWSMADLDRAVLALGGTLDSATLRRLAQVRTVVTELRVPLADALALWAPIDTWGRDSRYVALFQNRAVAALDELATFRLAYPYSDGGGDPDPELKSATQLPELATSGQKLGEHIPAVLAALRVIEPDLELIVAHLGLTMNVTLDVATLSALYRYTVLARGLRLRVDDLVSLLHLTGRDPFQAEDPGGTVAFIDIARTVGGSGFTVAGLDYLYRHAIRPTRTPAPVASRVAATITAVRGALLKVRADLGSNANVDDPFGDDLRAKLGLSFPEEVVTGAMAIVLGETGQLPADPVAFLHKHFAAFADPEAAVAVLLHPLPLDTKQRLQNIAWVRERLLPWLRSTRSRGEVAAVLSGVLGVDPALVRYLLEEHLTARVGTGAMMGDFLALADVKPEDAPAPGLLEDYELLHKAALVIAGFRLSAREVDHLIDHAAQFTGFGFDALPLQIVGDAAATALFAGWERVQALVDLRDPLPPGELTLIDLFQAEVPSGADPVKHLTGILIELTGWDGPALGELVAAHGLSDADFRTEVALRTLRAGLDVARRGGVGVAELVGWATTYPTSDQARAVVQAVKARYDEQRWFEVARTLNDRLREAQRDALVAFLVPRMSAQGVTTANQLYEHFLVDVGMQSCLATSRIKQAISAVQLFVQRCLLGLESPQVQPEDIDGEQWKWRKNYRVWEANRKVFLYPENWIEPELRAGKSPFFRQLETELLSAELTDDAVEQALHEYLHRLDEVARLDVRAMYWQEEAAPPLGGKAIDLVHVIARTPNPPHRYFYRRFVNHSEWTPWEPVELDIQGEHLVPVVYNRRLYLFWPTFTEKPLKEAQVDGADPLVRWEIGLCWSEYRAGGWSPIQRGSAADQMWIPPVLGHTWSDPYQDYAKDPGQYHLYVDELGSRLAIGLAGPMPSGGGSQLEHHGLATFALDGCRAPLQLTKSGADSTMTVPSDATVVASRYALGSASLVLEPNRPVLKKIEHPGWLVRSPDLLSTTKLYPFFFADARGAYFAYPVAVGYLLPGQAPDPWSVVIVTDHMHGSIDV